MTFGNLMATSEGGTLISKSVTRVHCNFITLLSTKIFQLYRDHLFYWWRKPKCPEKTNWPK